MHSFITQFMGARGRGHLIHTVITLSSAEKTIISVGYS